MIWFQFYVDTMKWNFYSTQLVTHKPYFLNTPTVKTPMESLGTLSTPVQEASRGHSNKNTFQTFFIATEKHRNHTDQSVALAAAFKDDKWDNILGKRKVIPNDISW